MIRSIFLSIWPIQGIKLLTSGYWAGRPGYLAIWVMWEIDVLGMGHVTWSQASALPWDHELTTSPV